MRPTLCLEGLQGLGLEFESLSLGAENLDAKK